MRKLLLLSIALVSTSAFSATLLVGVDDSAAPVYAYDTNNMAAGGTAINLGVEAWGMAGDDRNQILYVNAGSTLYSFDYATFTLQSTTTMTDGNGTNLSMVGLAFDPTTGTLYASRNTSPETLHAVDVNTGVSTATGVDFGADYDFGGIDFDENGNIYGTNDDSTPNGRGLFQLDLTGNAPVKIADYPVGETDIDGLGVGDGKAFLVEDDASATGSIHIYDFSTQQYSAVDTPWATSEIFASGAVINVVPEPATMSILGLGALALLRKRRKK